LIILYPEIINILNSGLYIVSTPIGNLKDITLRALDILKEADIIACEDTRTTSVLLNHYSLSKELISLNAVNENKRINLILRKIQEGRSCALVSDAGTPGISDPGTRLISAAIKEGFNVIPIPGATALITALTISGLPTDSFVFEGFLPQKKGRQKLLQKLSGEERTIILYESTYRIEKLLEELVNYMPDRFLVICRELTKKFEEVRRGYPAELLLDFNNRINKGEIVVILSPKNWKGLHTDQSSES
jgi:16S rRNA (cytidine1402-2'-O)-methyltransferase